MRIAGVDASTKCTGISIMNDGQLEHYVLIDLHNEKDVIKRMEMMMSKICEELDKHQLDKIYIEKCIFKGGNVDVTQKLSYLSGAMMLYCVQHNIEFNNPLPAAWRKKIGIEQSNKVKRDVLKAEAILAVKQEYGIDVGDDVAESLLLARSAFDLPKINISADDI